MKVFTRLTNSKLTNKGLDFLDSCFFKLIFYFEKRSVRRDKDVVLRSLVLDVLTAQRFLFLINLYIEFAF